MAESTTNLTGEIADTKALIARQAKLVAKREEMLARAIAEQERVDFKVERRTEILAEHEATLQALQAHLAECEAQAEQS